MSILSQQKQSVNTDFPNLRPSLDLRFALAKKLDPRITFTRGSTGTYFGPDGIMRTAGVNEPRFDHDPITGQSLGLLVEESSTNAFPSNNALSFFSTNSISTGDKNPDGTSSTLWVPSSSGNFHGLVPSTTNIDITSLAVGATIDVTVSLFAKDYNNSNLGVLMGFAAFDGTTYRYYLTQVYPHLKTVPGAPSGIGWSLNSLQAIPYPNGWYRFIFSGKYTKAAGFNTIVWVNEQIYSRSAQQFWFGDNSSGIYIWGIQREQKLFATSYIPTSGSTVTRNADKPNILDTSSFFNSTEGTLVVDSEMPYQTNGKFPSIGFAKNSINGSSNTIQFYYYNTSSPTATFLVRNTDAAGGTFSQLAVNLIEVGSGGQIVGSYKKFAGTYKFGEFNYYFDGKFVAKGNTNKALPSNLTYMEIGTLGSSDHRLNGRIKRITYYPIALTNQQLINLTS